MKFNLILVACSVLLFSNAAVAADKAPAKSTVIAAKGKMVIPPPPRETLPGNAAPPAPAGATRPEIVKSGQENTMTTVGQGAYTAANNKAQRFVDYIDIKPGMESAPLKLHLENKGFSWFRLTIASRIIATEKSLGGKTETDLDLTGVIQPGQNQVVIQAGGAPGAQINWKVTTPAVAKIEKVDPDEALVGTNVKIKGKNFSPLMTANNVYFNQKKGQVQKATPDQLEVKIPSDAEPGDTKVSVKVNGVESNKVTIKVRGIPEISGTNLQGVPPGQTLTIYGKNFSKVLSENQVFVGGGAAQVVGGDTNTLNIIVPMPANPAYAPGSGQESVGHTPSEIRVQVGKIMSKNSCMIQIGPQMYAEPGLDLGGRDIPTLNPRNLPGGSYPTTIERDSY